MGIERKEWRMPKKSRFFGLVERSILKPIIVKELKLAKSTAYKWNSDRHTRPLFQKLGRP